MWEDSVRIPDTITEVSRGSPQHLHEYSCPCTFQLKRNNSISSASRTQLPQSPRYAVGPTSRPCYPNARLFHVKPGDVTSALTLTSFVISFFYDFPLPFPALCRSFRAPDELQAAARRTDADRPLSSVQAHDAPRLCPTPVSANQLTSYSTGCQLPLLP
jgi:hypothetical protein